MRYFLDFQPGGSLCHFLMAMYKYKFDQGWRRFDLSSPSKKDLNLTMFKKAEEALVTEEIHLVPKLFIMKDLLDEEDTDRIKVRLIANFYTDQNWIFWSW